MTKRRWDGAGWDGCYDGEALAEVLTQVTGRAYRFVGEGSGGELVFDQPGRERTLFALGLTEIARLLFEVAARVPLDGEAAEREERD